MKNRQSCDQLIFSGTVMSCQKGRPSGKVIRKLLRCNYSGQSPGRANTFFLFLILSFSVIYGILFFLLSSFNTARQNQLKNNVAAFSDYGIRNDQLSEWPDRAELCILKIPVHVRVCRL